MKASAALLLAGAALAGAVSIAACAPGAPPPTAPSQVPQERASAAPEPGPPARPPTRVSRQPLRGPGEVAPVHPTGEPSESALVERTLRRVEAVRQLVATKPVPGVVLARADLIDRVKQHVARELPPEAIRDEGRVLQLFGFVPTQFDYEAETYALLQAQLAGYYEPSDGTMYMAADLGEDDASATLAHELVHALQDQHWNLEARSRYQPGHGDYAEAVSALAEGDATSAMLDVVISRSFPGRSVSAADVPDQVFAEQMRQSMSAAAGANAPSVMRSSLVAPYIYGTLFVNGLRRKGGWTAVDRAWDDPPQTSEQILHVEKWQEHEPALAVATPTFAALGPGWTVTDEDSEGELGARLAFEQWMPPAAAAQASSAWGGDRGALIAHGDEVAFAWRLRYDPGKSKDEHAAGAFTALRDAMAQSLGPATASDARWTCRERKDRGPIAMTLSGADIVFVLGPAHVVEQRWNSAGSCAISQRWLNELTR